MSQPHILIVGGGSVGRRHASNLHSLGCLVSCVDPRHDRLEQMRSQLPLSDQFTQLEAALNSGCNFSGAAICSPPAFHVQQSLLCLEAGLPVLLEKPVSPDFSSARHLYRQIHPDSKLMLGYTYRWWDPVRRLKSILNEHRIGSPRFARFFMSSHLADWHPWERYQDFFMASREMGGGALLDESHFIDLMLWLFGKPERLYARVEKISDLRITTDDFAELSVVYADRLRVNVHLDLIGRPHEKHITIVGEDGTIQCLFDPNSVRWSHAPDGEWQVESFAVERNDMFLAVAREFIGLITGSCNRLTCTLLDGLRVLEIIEACRQSQCSGCEIEIGPWHD